MRPLFLPSAFLAPRGVQITAEEGKGKASYTVTRSGEKQIQQAEGKETSFRTFAKILTDTPHSHAQYL